MRRIVAAAIACGVVATMLAFRSVPASADASARPRRSAPREGGRLQADPAPAFRSVRLQADPAPAEAGHYRRFDVAVGTTARSIQPGELVLLTLTASEAVDVVRVRAFERDLKPARVSSTSWHVLIGIDLDTKPGAHEVLITAGPSGTDQSTHTLMVLPKTFTTRELTVDPAFVNPPAAVSARIGADADRLNRIWSSSAAERLWSGPFVRPVPGAANSAFGSRSVYNGEPRSPHSGADFSGPSGTPVKSPNAGRVMLARDLYFTGNTVVIDHGAGLFSLFAHLRAMTVREFDSVTTGAVIGELGATGRVTGPHLHWAVRANDARVDPLSLLAVLGK